MTLAFLSLCTSVRASVCTQVPVRICVCCPNCVYMSPVDFDQFSQMRPLPSFVNVTSFARTWTLWPRNPLKSSKDVQCFPLNFERIKGLFSPMNLDQLNQLAFMFVCATYTRYELLGVKERFLEGRKAFR